MLYYIVLNNVIQKSTGRNRTERAPVKVENVKEYQE
jgi:hypothetical protein